MSQLSQQLALIDDRVDASLGQDACLVHFFNGKACLVGLTLHQPDLAEAALSYRFDEVEVVPLPVGGAGVLDYTCNVRHEARRIVRLPRQHLVGIAISH